MCISEFLIDSDSFLSSNSAEWPLFPYIENTSEVLARLKLELTFRPSPQLSRQVYIPAQT